MKIKKEKEFIPVKLEITFENQEEMDAFGCIFNHAWIIDAAVKTFNKSKRLYQMNDYIEHNNFETFDKNLCDIFKRRMS